jgi:hypothetical protein
MQNKFLVVTLFLFLPFSFIFGQTLELYGKKVTFGVSLSEQKNDFWQDGGQIESNYSYIEVYEGDRVTGDFFKNKLISIDIIANDNNAYPVCNEIENMLTDIKPYKQYTENDEVSSFIEIFKTSDFYISKASSRMNTEYIIIPIKMLDDIRSQHPEYLVKYF